MTGVRAVTGMTGGRAEPSVRIVIVNYRTAGLVIDCLHSLAGEVKTAGDCRVVIVENGSGDDSAARLREVIGREGWGWASVLVSDKNRGFAGGNNVALRPLLAERPPADYFLLLNPDTIARPGAVRELVSFMESHPKAGSAGSRLEDPDGTPQRCAFRFHTATSELERGLRLGLFSRLAARRVVAPAVRPETLRGEPYRTDWVCGASMIIRRDVLETVGLLDEGYFLYFEETDLCLRAARAGWQCWHVPASRVVHLEGQSTGVTGVNRPRNRIPTYWLAARRRYFEKNHGRAYATVADLLWVLGYASWRVRRRLQGKPDPDPPQLLWDFVRFASFGRGT